jgi:hypothetical protein
LYPFHDAQKRLILPESRDAAIAQQFSQCYVQQGESIGSLAPAAGHPFYVDGSTGHPSHRPG